jgi:hypothetical protein
VTVSARDTHRLAWELLDSARRRRTQAAELKDGATGHERECDARTDGEREHARRERRLSKDERTFVAECNYGGVRRLDEDDARASKCKE